MTTLARRIEDQLDEVEVLALEPLAGGACQDSYTVEVHSRGQRKTWVLRSDAAGHLPDSLSRRDEYPIIEAARHIGVETPAVHGLFEDLVRPGASAYFMDFVPGIALGGKVVASPALSAVRPTLLSQLAKQLALVHSITPSSGLNVESGGGDSALQVGPVKAALARHRRALDQLERPLLELAWQWLSENGPDDGPVVLCHGDFRTGNFQVDPDRGLVAILDWEFAHWGCPADDLGWAMVRDWRFGQLDKPGFGLASRQELLDTYERASQLRPSSDEVFYWEVMGNLRWAIGAIHQGLRYAGGESDLELFAIGRRALEIEYEVVRLIERGAP